MQKRFDNVTERDQRLWTEFKSGNHEAYTSLIQNYFKPMFTYGIRINKDYDFVKDCVQDVVPARVKVELDLATLCRRLNLHPPLVDQMGRVVAQHSFHCEVHGFEELAEDIDLSVGA